MLEGAVRIRTVLALRADGCDVTAKIHRPTEAIFLAEVVGAETTFDGPRSVRLLAVNEHGAVVIGHIRGIGTSLWIQREWRGKDARANEETIGVSVHGPPIDRDTIGFSRSAEGVGYGQRLRGHRRGEEQG